MVDYSPWTCTELDTTEATKQRTQYHTIKNRDSYNFSFPIWMPFIFVAELLWLQLPILGWIKVERVDILVFDLRREAHSFPLLCMILVVGLSDIACIILKDILYVPSVLSMFIMKRCWILSKLFFCSHWDDFMIFILYFVKMMYHNDWLVDVEPLLLP